MKTFSRGNKHGLLQDLLTESELEEVLKKYNVKKVQFKSKKKNGLFVQSHVKIPKSFLKDKKDKVEKILKSALYNSTKNEVKDIRSAY